MAIAELPLRPRTSAHQGPFVNEPFYRFQQGRKCAQDARRHRESPRPTGPRIRPDHRRQANQDHGQDQVAESGQAVAGGRHPSESRQRARRTRHAGRAEAHSNPGAAPRSKSAPACCSASPTCCASANLNSAPGWFSKSARTGPKPTPISPRPSTSVNIMPAKPCASPRSSLPCKCPASTIRCTTFRSASAR